MNGTAAWARAKLALKVLAVDPIGLGGLWLRARTGPAREAFLIGLKSLPGPVRSIHPQISEDQLFGGLDIGATLAQGSPRYGKGLFDTPGIITLTMAERCPARLSAHLGAAADTREHCLVALDEGADSDEAAPPALTERLGLFVALDGIPTRDLSGAAPDAEEIRLAQARLPTIGVSDGDRETLVAAAAGLGIGSLRVPGYALAASRVLAALEDRSAPTADNLEMAAMLVYAHRAAPLAETGAEETPPPPPEDVLDSNEASDGEQDQLEIPSEVLLEAVRAALPPDVLEALASGRANRSAAGVSGTGAARRGNRRGRPLPSRPGRLDGQNRIDLVATLRAAAPWQPMRRKTPGDRRLHIRREDIRVRRYEETSDRLLIFAVDASGSLAMARLAEAKGAIELLLGEAYARRDHVALLAFRGTDAELLLPPTRSLVQTKRRLQALPGGGGTPLAAGLALALETAHAATRRGMTPTLALLTDGRANIALSGRANRRKAAEDAERMAKAIRAEGVPSLVIDTASRPQTALAALAGTLDAGYIALPRADAHRLSSAVSTALEG